MMQTRIIRLREDSELLPAGWLEQWWGEAPIPEGWEDVTAEYPGIVITGRAPE